jgi:hypothetical protein
MTASRANLSLSRIGFNQVLGFHGAGFGLKKLLLLCSCMGQLLCCR